MVSGKKRNHKVAEAHTINLDGEFGTQVYQSRLQRKHGNNSSDESENNQILGMANFLNQLYGDAVITNPQTGVKCTINNNIDPTSCYLLSSGDYQYACISSMKNYIKHGDIVTILGAGIGLLPVVASFITERFTYCYEPQNNLHSIILKNARLNNIDIKLELSFKDIFDLKPKANILIVDLAKQDKNFLQKIKFNNLESVILFEDTGNTEKKFIAKVISEIINHGFTMDTMVDNVYIFKKTS